MIKVSFGKSFDTAAAVKQCAAGVAGEPVRLLLAFCGGKHDSSKALAALRAEFGDVPIVGGSAAGALWNGGGGYSGLEIGVVAFMDDALRPTVLASGGLRENERQAGHHLGQQVAQVATEGAVVVMLFDSVASNPPLRLHPASDIVGGFTAGLNGRMIRLVGGGMLTDMNLSDGWVFDGHGVRKHAAVALVFPPQVAAAIEIFHGCRPVSTFMEITRIEGAEVFELDGQPAMHMIERMLGVPLGGSPGHDLSLIATLGEKQGDPFAPYDENAYVNRLILRVNRSIGSITLFEPDFERGTRVQIMSRDNALMLDSVRHGMAAINRAIAGRESFLALYIDCAGRASARSGAAVEEADLVREAVPRALPLLGFYSGVEIAPFEGYSRPLDWTGVITVLHRQP
jgi:hypothetical protein